MSVDTVEFWEDYGQAEAPDVLAALQGNWYTKDTVRRAFKTVGLNFGVVVSFWREANRSGQCGDVRIAIGSSDQR